MPGLEDLFGGLDASNVDADELLSRLDKLQGTMARSAQRMALETADAWSRDELVRVWVNAQGVVVQVDIDDDRLANATGAEVSAAMVAAAQAAAATMRAKTQAFQSGLWQQVASFASPGARPVTEIDEFKQMQPTVPLSPPGSPDRKALADALAGEQAERREGESSEWQLSIRDDR